MGVHLPTLKTNDVRRILRTHGFELIRVRKHETWGDGQGHYVQVQKGNKTILPATLHSIAHQAGFATIREFVGRG